MNPLSLLAVAALATRVLAGPPVIEVRDPEPTAALQPTQESPRVVVFRRDTYELRNIRGGKGKSQSLFAPSGVKALATGRIGNEVRIELPPSLAGWVPLSSVQFLPAGTPPPRAVLGTIRVDGDSRSSKLRLSLSEAVPYRVEIESRLLRLILYYTDAHTNWIVYGTDNPMIREVRWSQEADGVARVDVWLSPEAIVSGYDLAYEADALGVELRWRPIPPPAGEDGRPPGSCLRSPRKNSFSPVRAEEEQEPQAETELDADLKSMPADLRSVSVLVQLGFPAVQLGRQVRGPGRPSEPNVPRPRAPGP